MRARVSLSGFFIHGRSAAPAFSFARHAEKGGWASRPILNPAGISPSRLRFLSHSITIVEKDIGPLMLIVKGLSLLLYHGLCPFLSFKSLESFFHREMLPVFFLCLASFLTIRRWPSDGYFCGKSRHASYPRRKSEKPLSYRLFVVYYE